MWAALKIGLTGLGGVERIVGEHGAVMAPHAAGFAREKRQAGNLLTKISWWGGGIFLGLAFLISLTSSNTSAPRSILDQTFTPPPAQTAPANPQPGTNVLPIQPAPTGDAAAPAPAPTKTP